MATQTEQRNGNAQTAQGDKIDKALGHVQTFSSFGRTIADHYLRAQRDGVSSDGDKSKYQERQQLLDQARITQTNDCVEVCVPTPLGQVCLCVPV